MNVFTGSGITSVDVPDPFERSTIGAHWNAIGEYVRSGNAVFLAPFEGVEVAGRVLQTDPEAIDEWWLEGQFDYIEVYEG